MKMLTKYVFTWWLALLVLSFSLDAVAGQSEIWQCQYKTIYDEKFAFNSEYEMVGAKKLLGPFDEYSGRRLEYEVVLNTKFGLIAISTYFNKSQSETTSELMGVTTISLQKNTGKFKLIATQVGDVEEEKYLGTCKLKK